MNPFRMIRDGIRITFHTGALWIIALLLCLVMIPAFLFSGGFGAVTVYLMMSGKESSPEGFFLPLQNISTGGWVLYVFVTLILLTVSSLLTWAVQAAMIRAADSAADGKPVAVVDSLRLGRQRWGSLAKLALTFGLAIQALGILPPLLALVAREKTTWGFALTQLVQAFLTPVSIILGILIFLLTMSIALEDIRPKMAIGRIWRLVRSGWWGFLLAYVFQAILALAAAFLFAVILAVVLLILMLGLLNQSTAEIILGGAICLISSPAGLLVLIFILVFSTVLFTLTYRAAAGAATAEKPHPPG